MLRVDNVIEMKSNLRRGEVEKKSKWLRNSVHLSQATQSEDSIVENGIGQ